MQIDNDELRELLSKDLVEVMIRVGLIALLVIMCFRIFAPFMSLMLWAVILAVSLYPLHLRLAKLFGNRQGAAATALVLAGLLLIGWPTVVLASSFAEQIHNLYQAFSTGSVTVKVPDPAVAEWPIIGEKLYSAWSAAAADLPGFLERMQPQLGNFARQMLSVATGTMGAVLLFLGALIFAGIMMAFGASGSSAMERIAIRVVGPARGPYLHNLSTATIRSVATGVIGVAFIQALLLGVGFGLAGVPAAGVLAALVMILGIMQLPPVLITLPVIGYLWWAGDASTTSNIVWSVYLMLASMADNILKPLLLGRGVDAPMPVVLIGALGGMVVAGIVGLFVGAVLLAVGYVIFMDWVDNAETTSTSSESDQPADKVPAASD